MINAEFLSQCSDEQINRGVAWLTIKEWGDGNKHKRKSIDYYCSQGLLNSVAAGNVNYCTNPNDIMPIAFANGINLVSPGGRRSKWSASQSSSGGMWSINDFVRSHENPLRAICEVYILMSVNK